MVVEYSKDNYRLFYGLKANGKYYFKDDSQNEISTKEMTFTNDNITEANRYEAKNIFVTFNSKEYLFSIATYTSVVELIDLNEGNNITYKIKIHSNFLNEQIFSFVFSLLKMETNPQQYLISYVSETNNYMLQKFYFSNFGLDSNSDFTLLTTSNPYEIKYLNRLVNSFIMDSEIVVFLVNWDKSEYILYIYDDDLNVTNQQNQTIIDTISNFNDGVGIFSKAYHLENRDAVFIYFTSPDPNALKLKAGTISQDGKSFTVKIEKNINEYNFNCSVLLNDFVKIDSNRFI